MNSFIRLHVLVDSQDVVNAVKGDYDWSIYPIILDIKALARFLVLQTEYAPRGPTWSTLLGGI